MRTVQLRRYVPALVALVLAAAPLRAQTIGSPSDGGGIDWWAGQTVGQTFTAPNAWMSDFSFWVNPVTNSSFRAYVYAWNDATNQVSGSALFESAILTPPSGSDYVEINVPTGISLTTGGTYIAFFSRYGFGGDYNWMRNGANHYAGGQEMFLTSGNPATAYWNDYFDFQDLQFQANFAASAVPEPGTLVLLGTGLSALAAAVRRRRKA